VNFGITRIGLHAGPPLVGNFSGSRFFDYTAYGDAINTAARLEAANKFLGTRICVSATLAERTQNFQDGPLGDLILRVAAASRCVPMSLCRRMPSRRRR